MIEVRNLSKQFGKLQVLQQVNLQFGEGECVALIGPNGCGKTTLIKILLGIVLPGSGDVLFKGKSILHQFEYRRAIGYMPQIGRYPDNMCIGQVIDMMREIRNSGEAPDDFLYRAWGLEKLSDKKMHTLSGGTTQKVSATLAFYFNPEVLILDEPTAGLDPVAAEILKEKILEEKRKGKLILITSHLLSELDDLVTGIVFMEEGKIRFHKSVDELKSETGHDKLSKAITHILKGGRLGQAD